MKDAETQRLIESLRKAHAIVLATHQAPDGDGLGCQLALRSVLQSQGASVRAFIEGPLPSKLLFLPGSACLEDWQRVPETERVEIFARSDLALVLDTHDWALAGSLGERLRHAPFPTLFLDHHPAPAAFDRPELFSDPCASSTGELCWDLVRGLAPRIDPGAATCLYAAIAYDTNSFKYLRGRASAHRAAADLMEAGADAEAVYRNMFASRSPRRIVQLAKLVEGVRHADDGRIAWLVIPRDATAACALSREDLRDLVTFLVEMEGVEVAFTLQEEDGSVKLSLRSMGRVPVNGVARRLGGGGHLFAAAAQWNATRDEAESTVLALVREAALAAPPPRAGGSPGPCR